MVGVQRPRGSRPRHRPFRVPGLARRGADADPPDPLRRRRRRRALGPFGSAWRWTLLSGLVLVALLVLPLWMVLAGPVPFPRPEVVALQTGYSVDWDMATCAKLPAPEHRVCEFGPLFNAAGAEHKVDPRFLAAVAAVESGFEEAVIDCSKPSAKGALGLMQFRPGTAAERGVNPCDTTSAIYGAARYLTEAHKEFAIWELAAAAYNAGFEAVRDAQGIPPNPETVAYVPKVMAKYEQYKALFQGAVGKCPLPATGGSAPRTFEHVTPATQTMISALITCYGFQYGGDCYDDEAWRKHLYEHPRGRACDIMTTRSGSSDGADRVRGTAMAEWLAANAKELKVLYVIWYERVWNPSKDVYKPWSEWRTYKESCVNGGCDHSTAHRNHVHVSIQLQPGDPSWAACIPGISCTENYRYRE